jgi:hypothetical protein
MLVDAMDAQFAVPWPTGFVSGFWLRLPAFSPRPGLVGFAVDQGAVGQVFWEYMFPLPILVPLSILYLPSIIRGWSKGPKYQGTWFHATLRIEGKTSHIAGD